MRSAAAAVVGIAFALVAGLLVAVPVPSAVAGCERREVDDDAIKTRVGPVTAIDGELRRLGVGGSLYAVGEELDGLEQLELGSIVRVRHLCARDRETIIWVSVLRWAGTGDE